MNQWISPISGIGFPTAPLHKSVGKHDLVIHGAMRTIERLVLNQRHLLIRADAGMGTAGDQHQYHEDSANNDVSALADG